MELYLVREQFQSNIIGKVNCANGYLPDFLFCHVRSVHWFGRIVMRGCTLRSLLGSYIHQK